MNVVPFTSDYAQRFITVLGDGNKYVFDSYWNERGQLRTFDLTRDSDQVLLIAGAPLLIGQDLLAPYALGIGALVVTDLNATDTDAGPDDLNDRVIVVSFSNDEIAAIRAALGPLGKSLLAGSGAPLPPPSSGSSAGSGGGSTVGETIINNNTINTSVTNVQVTGGLGFSRYAEDSDASGNEVLFARFVQLPGLSLSPTVALTAAILASGEGTVRIYVGGNFEAIGTVGTPTGTLRGSIDVTGAGEHPYQSTGSFANPGGMVAVKFTMQATSPGTAVGVSYEGGGIT